MKIKFLFAVCLSIIAVSCGPKDPKNTPTPKPPVIANKLTSVIASDKDIGSPFQTFEAVYDNGHITELRVAEWMDSGLPDNAMGSIQSLPASKSPMLGKLMRSTAFSNNDVRTAWMYEAKVKYEKGRIVLIQEEDGYKEELILIQDNSGRVVSMTFKDEEGELELMKFSYNKDGQLSEYVINIYWSSDVDGDYIESWKITFEYVNGSISTVLYTITEKDEVLHSYTISYNDVTVENKQGIFMPFLDNSGWMTALSTLDIIGLKSARLPKSGIIKVHKLDGETIPEIEGLSITMDLDYGMTVDGYLQNLKSVIKMSISIIDPDFGPIEQHEEMETNFEYKFEK